MKCNNEFKTKKLTAFICYFTFYSFVFCSFIYQKLGDFLYNPFNKYQHIVHTNPNPINKLRRLYQLLGLFFFIFYFSSNHNNYDVNTKIEFG